MLVLKDITEFFKTLNTQENWGIENYYRGKLDNKKNKSLGFYDLKSAAYEIPVGGPDLKYYDELYVSLLIHWNNNFDDTEEISNKIYYKLIDLYNTKPLIINNYYITQIKMLSNNEDVGTDEKGIYERVIQFKVVYKNTPII